MAETASASPVGPRYAPEDPTLPKPWKGLVDGTTGYLYFWNPETNITQYERPKASSGHGPSPAPAKSTSASISSSVQIHHSTQGHLRSSRNNDDVRQNGDINGRPKLAAIPVGKSHQVDKFLVLESRSTKSAMLYASIEVLGCLHYFKGRSDLENLFPLDLS